MIFKIRVISPMITALKEGQICRAIKFKNMSEKEIENSICFPEKWGGEEIFVIHPEYYPSLVYFPDECVEVLDEIL